MGFSSLCYGKANKATVAFTKVMHNSNGIYKTNHVFLGLMWLKSNLVISLIILIKMIFV